MGEERRRCAGVLQIHQDKVENVVVCGHVYLGCFERRKDERETEEVDRHLKAVAERAAYLGAERTAGRMELPTARRRH